MKKNFIVIIVSIMLGFILPAGSFAANDSTDDFTPRTKKIYLEPEQSLLKQGKMKYLLAATAGYDSNTKLNSDRNGDAFMQTYFKAAFSVPLSLKTDARVDYEMMNLLYAGNKPLDLTRNGIHLGLDHKLSKDLLVSTSYSFDAVEYISASEDDLLDNSVEVKLTQQLPQKMFHSVAYDVLFRYYDERYTRVTDGAATDKPRNDWRNTVTYEIGKYFKKDLIKFNAGCFHNNSNETYLKYYDYNSYKIGASLTHLFSNKVSGILAYTKQYRDYKSRTLINDVNTKEFEKSDLITTALFYSLNKSVSFGLNYTFRQNNSNEPIDSYSGSIVSLSTYYKF